MLGPIFNAEMLQAGRCGRSHILRWIYAAWLCMQLVYVYDQTHAVMTYGIPPAAPVTRLKADSNFCQHFRDLVLVQQFFLIVLVTPAFVAGAITDEKTRGTLQGLLTAYVTPTDIVLGKLAARTAQIGVLALTPLPLLALVGQYAGVSPEFLLALVAVTFLVLAGVGGISMLASVWSRQTRTAVIATYAILIAAVWLLSFLVNIGWLSATYWDCFDPIQPLMPSFEQGDTAETFHRIGQVALGWGGIGLLTTTIAVVRLRPAYIRQLEARPRRRLLGAIVGRPRPFRDVIAWKECYVGRRVPYWIGLPLTVAVAAAVTMYTLDDFAASRSRVRGAEVLATNGLTALFLLTLVVGVRCSGSITGERERHTWDGLMTSPLTPREIVHGKLRGVLSSMWPYLLAAWMGAGLTTAIMTTEYSILQIAFGPLQLVALGVCAFTVSIIWAPRSTGWVALGVVLLAVGSGGPYVALVAASVVIVTCLAMYFFGAVGLACSARSRSSWRSLLATLFFGYAGWMVASCIGLPVGCIGTLFFDVIFVAVRNGIFGYHADPSIFTGRWTDVVMKVTWPLGSACALWFFTRSILLSAENTIAKRDRIPPEWVRMIEFDLGRHDRPGSYRRYR